MLKKTIAGVQHGITLCFLPFFLLLTFTSLAQEKITVTGTVSSDSKPLADVSVNVVDQSTGTITRADGTFTLQVNKGATLLFSIIGYEEKRIKADGSVLNVQLTSTNSTLNEVIVVGYGTTKKTTFGFYLASFASLAARLQASNPLWRPSVSRCRPTARFHA